jgi:hypothetical protein
VLTVSGNGFDPHRNNNFGVYVVFGPKSANYWTNANAFGAAKWVHPGAAASGGQDVLRPDGSFRTTLNVSAKYRDGDGKSIDCTATPCYVLTFAAHGVPDRSQDTTTRVTFAAPVAPPTTPPPTTTPPQHSSTVAPAPPRAVSSAAVPPGGTPSSISLPTSIPAQASGAFPGTATAPTGTAAPSPQGTTAIPSASPTEPTASTTTSTVTTSAPDEQTLQAELAANSARHNDSSGTTGWLPWTVGIAAIGAAGTGGVLLRRRHLADRRKS